MKLSVLNPTTFSAWNDLIMATPGASIFHSSNWAKVLRQSYRYCPVYFCTVANDHFGTLIPLMEVRSFLTGRRGVSLPFTDYCPPIVEDNHQLSHALAHITEYGRKARWKFIEFRNGSYFDSSLPPTSYYYGHTLELSGGEEVVFSNLRESTRRNIKKAKREGVKAAIETSSSALHDYYRLHCLTRKRHGLPPQPLHFFQNIYEHIISKGFGFVVLASHGGQTIAGAVYFCFGDQALYKFGASDRDYQQLRANNLVMWEAICRCLQKGHSCLSFGRTEPDNLGLIQFKAGWGAHEEVIKYYRYDVGRGALVGACSNTSGAYTGVLAKMPIAFLRLAGALAYRHMG